MGLYARLRGLLDDAELRYREAYGIAQNNIHINRELASLYCKRKRYTEAETHARAAYQIAPTNPFIIDIMAEVLLGRQGMGFPVDPDELSQVMRDLLAGFGLPTWLAWPIVVAELFGGLAILLGFHARLVSAALLPILVGALAIHAPNGWLFTAPNGGWEYPAFLALAALAQVLVGDGAYALRPSGLSGTPARRPLARAA